VRLRTILRIAGRTMRASNLILRDAAKTPLLWMRKNPAERPPELVARRA
jgi:hypothetical protein